MKKTRVWKRRIHLVAKMVTKSYCNINDANSEHEPWGDFGTFKSTKLLTCLPVNNRRRCRRSPCLYRLLALCRCCFPELCPGQETHTERQGTADLFWLEWMRFRDQVWFTFHSFNFTALVCVCVMSRVPPARRWWKAGFGIQAVHHWRLWQRPSRSQRPESSKILGLLLLLMQKETEKWVVILKS